MDTTPPNIPSPSTQTPTNNNSRTWSSNSDVIDYEIILDNVLIEVKLLPRLLQAICQRVIMR